MTKGNRKKQLTEIMQFISPFPQCTLSLCLHAVCAVLHISNNVQCPANWIKTAAQSLVIIPTNNSDLTPVFTQSSLATSRVQMQSLLHLPRWIKYGNMQVHCKHTNIRPDSMFAWTCFSAYFIQQSVAATNTLRQLQLSSSKARLTSLTTLRTQCRF